MSPNSRQNALSSLRKVRSSLMTSYPTAEFGLNNSGVIPGKLAIPPEADQAQAEASDTRNLEIVGAG